MPPGTCVLCGADNKRTKLVSCLHSLCLLCLEQSIEDDGSIICPSCKSTTPLQQAGCHPVSSLPDSCLKTVDTSNEGSLPSCDECVDVQVAVCRCPQCSTSLCDIHTQGHKRSRATHEHVLLALDRSAEGATASAAQPAHICALHTTKTITHFCHECQKLMCQRCIDTKTHELHKDALVPLGEAAEKMRQSVRENLSTCVSGESVGLETAREKVRSTITALNDQIECASEHATEFFQGMMEAVKARETKVLDKLDQLRAQKLAPLENQLQKLEEGISQTDMVTSILDSSHDYMSFMRMSKWLNTAITTARQIAQSHSEPCTVQSIAFAATETHDVLDAIEKSGVCVDIAESTLICPEEANIGCDTTISIDMSKSSENLTISPDQLSRMDINITVTDPDGETVPCRTLQRSPNSQRIEANCRPIRAGEHTVSATIAGTHLKRSPVHFNVRRPFRPVFDVNHCDSSFEISDCNQRVRKAERTAHYRAAYSMQISNQCRSSQAAFFIDNLGNRYDLYICADFSDEPTVDGRPARSNVFGWYAGRSKYGTFTGTELGQPWQSGDEITL
eukprot:scpid68619/ scgid8276/ Tripartite motif-containing protein 45